MEGIIASFFLAILAYYKKCNLRILSWDEVFGPDFQCEYDKDERRKRF